MSVVCNKVFQTVGVGTVTGVNCPNFTIAQLQQAMGDAQADATNLATNVCSRNPNCIVAVELGVVKVEKDCIGNTLTVKWTEEFKCVGGGASSSSSSSSSSSTSGSSSSSSH